MSIKTRLLKLEITKQSTIKDIIKTIMILWETEHYGEVNGTLYTPEQIEELYTTPKYHIINIRLDDGN